MTSALFQELVSGGPTAVRSLVGRCETLVLDFKTKAPAKEGGDRGDRRTLAKALSAFANSMGGLLVWGVECRKNADGIDEVSGFKPVEQLAKFTSVMRDWTVEAVMPKLADVEVCAIDEGGDNGFLLIDVPRSERRPHRCEIGEKLYYRRAGASSRSMEHFEIEDAFRRVSAPELQIEYRLEEGGGQIIGPVGNEVRALAVAAVLISLRNTSRISARSAYLGTFQNAPFPHWNHMAKNKINVRDQPPQRFFEIEPATIHPGVARLVMPLQLRFDLFCRRGIWQARREQYCEAMTPFDVCFGCLDSPMRTETIQLTELEITSALNPKPHGIE